jgi:hypothetical protein
MYELSTQPFPIFDIALLDPESEGVPGWVSLDPDSAPSLLPALRAWLEAHPAVHRLQTEADFNRRHPEAHG